MNGTGNDQDTRAETVPPADVIRKEGCFACDRPMSSKYLVGCQDDQTAYVGAECFKRIRRSHADGWQPPKGGPRLFCLSYTKHGVPS